MPGHRPDADRPDSEGVGPDGAAAAAELVDSTDDESTPWVLGSRRAALQLLDRDGDGEIGADDLRRVAAALGEALSDSETRAMLQQLNEQKWTVLLKHTFGCEPAARITLSEARDLAIAMVDAMQSPDVIRQMEESKTGIAANLSEQERQNLVARAVVGVQSDVIQKAGYDGDAGYAQAQVCLMEHANDAVVTASVAAATTALYARAGINLQAAIQQAMGQ